VRQRIVWIATASVIGFLAAVGPRAQPLLDDFHTKMMNATIEIVGPAGQNSRAVASGSAFVVGKPSGNQILGVVVTAAHVLEGISGDYANFVVRTTEGGQIKTVQARQRIRREGRPVWVKHPDADVAAMYGDWPSNIFTNWISPDQIADDEFFSQYEIHPGDEVFVVGYPQGALINDFGFAILRSGHIASYPLTPAEKVRSFAVDVRVFAGNSGSPVYLSNNGRYFGGVMQVTASVNAVLGIVTQQVLAASTTEPLGVARVVYGQFIKETIDRLPSPQ